MIHNKPQEFTFSARTTKNGDHYTVQLSYSHDDTKTVLFTKDVKDEPGRHDPVDQAFQEFVTSRDWDHAFTFDDALLEALKTKAEEHDQGVIWYRRTYRFLHSTMNDATTDESTWLLTSDKSSLPAKYQRILEVGEEQALQEDRDAEAQRQKTAREEQERLREVAEEHHELIIKIVRDLLDDKNVEADDVTMLINAGLFQETTTFRSTTNFPGEAQIMHYDLRPWGVELFGFIGVDEHGKLISLDERSEQKRTSKYYCDKGEAQVM